MSDIIILEEKETSQKSRKVSVNFSLDIVNQFLLNIQKISVPQKAIFYRLLATMVTAGLPLLKALDVLARQEKNPLILRLYTALKNDIRTGKTLSGSLRDYSGNFSEAECSLIESGEKTGRLNSALIQLAEQVEKVNSITKKLKGALIYPAALVIVMAGAFIVIMTVVVPKIVEIFGDKTKLPPFTQFLINTSDFLVSEWLNMIVLLVVIVVAIQTWQRTPLGRYYLDRIRLRIPIFGGITRRVILSKFARVFSNLLSNGISIVESLRIISEVVDNDVYRQRFLLLREDVKNGIKIGESLENDPLFPEILVQMIKIGEETAKLDSIIIKVAEMYDEETELLINNVQKLLEPIIIVAMAVMVGIIAVGVMQPIMNLSETVSSN